MCNLNEKKGIVHSAIMIEEIMSLMEKKMLDIVVYQVMIGTERDDSLTNHGEDHCHED